MSEVLIHYESVNPITWVYLSSLLLIGLFFKFGRFWSVRNLDIVLLILLAPGLLMVHYGQAWEVNGRLPATIKKTLADSKSEITKDEDPPDDEAEEDVPTAAESARSAQEGRANRIKRLGFIWLLAVGVLFVVRLLLDPTMVRRPLLDPNLSVGGLSFIGCALFVFLMANVLNSPVRPASPALNPAINTALDSTLDSTAEEVPSADAERAVSDPGQERMLSPGYQLLAYLPEAPTDAELARGQITHTPFAHRLSQIIAILAQLAIVIGMVMIGYRHFNNIRMGIGAATMYLMLPYTEQMTGQVHHVLPAAFLVWSVTCYRRPFTSGILIGLSIIAYYPIFLLPLWMSFYWQRGLRRFLSGVCLSLVALSLLLLTVANSGSDYLFLLRKMFGLMFRMNDLGGVWGLGWYPIYRIPLLAAFGALCGTLALWPAQKNLGTLLSCSAAVMVASQFWNGDGGGLYMAWYLPLVLLTIFRPNLEDRVALSVLGEGWFPRRSNAKVEQSAA